MVVGDDKLDRRVLRQYFQRLLARMGLADPEILPFQNFHETGAGCANIIDHQDGKKLVAQNPLDRSDHRIDGAMAVLDNVVDDLLFGVALARLVIHCGGENDRRHLTLG
ncbi:hypothetical protein D3C78_1140420 [compost metagenome]